MLVGFIVLKYSYYEFHLIIKVVTPKDIYNDIHTQLDIHLIIKVVTPCKMEYSEYQHYITKIKQIF